MLNLNFRDLDIKIKYDSDNTDILNEFYIPMLSNSIKYFRLSGFFSSTSLAISAQGLEDFIKKDGKMQLICSAILSKDDFVKIKEFYSSPIELIEEKFLFDLKNISNVFVKDNLAALGFMLANNNLEIKIAVPKDENGIFHSKIGILVDSLGDMVSFSGSDNETAYGWKYNIEEFKVFKSWVSGQDEYFNEDLDNFYQYWDNLTKRSEIIDLPEAVTNELICLAPKHLTELRVNDNIFDNNMTDEFNKDNVEKPSFKLRDYQKEAIDNWFNSNKSGIFEMATGTGKTFTALGCANQLLEEYSNKHKPLLVIIATPTSHLVDQWEKDVLKFDVDLLVKAYSNNNSWKKNISEQLLDLSIGELSNIVILTTHKTLAKDYFREFMSECSADSLIIIDEVHGIGSSYQRLALDDSLYDYKLGLSATPERWFDDDGNEAINDFFGDVVYKFTLSDALIRTNPDTGKTFLTPYEYHPIFVDLTEEEFDDYSYYTAIISRLFNELKNKNSRDKSKIKTEIKNNLRKRQNILNLASNKYIEFKSLISKLKQERNNDIKNLLIYCHDTNQLKKINSILNDEKILKHKFTGEESIEERLNLLNHFSEGDIHALVAMKCLDEGVDVPSAETAIILASTSNPREYIQRRGRILRRHPNKELAIIYDMIVSLSEKHIHRLNKNQMDLELKIMEKESMRYREFAKDSVNYNECYDLLDEYYRVVLK